MEYGMLCCRITKQIGPTVPELMMGIKLPCSMPWIALVSSAQFLQMFAAGFHITTTRLPSSSIRFCIISFIDIMACQVQVQVLAPVHLAIGTHHSADPWPPLTSQPLRLIKRQRANLPDYLRAIWSVSDNVRSLILSECQSIAQRGHVVIIRDTTTFLFTALLIPKNIIIMTCDYGKTLSRYFKDILPSSVVV